MNTTPTVVKGGGALLAAVLALLTTGCPNVTVESDRPFSGEGPRLLIFDPILSAEVGAEAPPPPATKTRVREILADVFTAADPMFEDKAFDKAGRKTPCPDLRCYAEVARKVEAEWMLYSRVFSFVIERCMFRTTLTSIETGHSFTAVFPGEAKEERVGSEIRYIIDDPATLAQCHTDGFYERVSRVAANLETEHRGALRR